MAAPEISRRLTHRRRRRIGELFEIFGVGLLIWAATLFWIPAGILVAGLASLVVASNLK